MIKKIIVSSAILLALFLAGDAFNLNAYIFLGFLGVIFAVVIGFYVVNKKRIDYFINKRLGIRNLMLYLNIIVLFIVYILRLFIDFLRDHSIAELYFIIFSIIGFLLLAYNLSECLNQKKVGIIWWPLFLIASLVSVQILFLSLSGVFGIYLDLIAFAVMIIYLATAVYGLIRLLMSRR